jgi:hypothetical protein
MQDGSTLSDLPQTYYAPAGRDTPDECARKVETFTLTIPLR